MVYPYYERLQNLVPGMKQGNFGLWYNKMIPLGDFRNFKPSDLNGDDKNPVAGYCRQYQNTRKETVAKLLKQKHLDQERFCDDFSGGYEILVLSAELISPLITGIGETHPHEVSLIFEHNIGIPYIPASGVKGIVRFAHSLGLLENINDLAIMKDTDGNEYFEEENEETGIPQIFGTQKGRGGVIFLDAYSEKVPDLHVDIMNPHYGEYYSDETNTEPPGDYLNPNPIKFLMIAPGTVFVFRALVDKANPDLIEPVENAFVKALTEEGAGAKTAVGYGLFRLREKAKSIPHKSDAVASSSDAPSAEFEKIERFQMRVSGLKNLPAEIAPFLEEAKAVPNPKVKKELCRILHKTAKDRLGSKYRKALRNGKNWARTLDGLCREAGIVN